MNSSEQRYRVFHFDRSTSEWVAIGRSAPDLNRGRKRLLAVRKLYPALLTRVLPVDDAGNRCGPSPLFAQGL